MAIEIRQCIVGGHKCVSIEPQTEFGGGADIVIDLKDVPDLINALCSIPQVAELNGSTPLVLYFHTEKDREEFAAVVKAGMKKVRTVKV